MGTRGAALGLMGMVEAVGSRRHVEMMMTRKVLTPAAAMEIKRLYDLQDSFGRRLHSQMEIATMLGVSETTVFRTIHRRGAYMGVRDLPTDDEAAASEARFRKMNPHLFEDTALAKMQAAVAEVKEQPERVNAMLKDIATSPRSPLDE